MNVKKIKAALLVATASAALTLLAPVTADARIKAPRLKLPHVELPKLPDPIKIITGRNGGNLVEHHIEKLNRAVDQITTKPLDYIAGLPKSLLADICSAPVQYYEGTLAGQAAGRWQSLPPQLVAAVQSEYPNARLDAVRYATGIRTSNGAAQTFGHEIYFPRDLDLTDADDMGWMLHELEHTQQYARAGSQASKLCEYMSHAVGSGFRHESIPMEQAADRKAQYLLPRALAAMTGGGMPRQAAVASASSGLAPYELAIVNDTTGPVVFTLASKWTAPTQLTLEPGAREVYPTHPSDGEFRVSVMSYGQTVAYDIAGGTGVRLRWNDRNLLDVYPE